MSVTQLPRVVSEFLSAYLAVESSVRRAAQAFVAHESRATVEDLAAAIKTLLQSDPRVSVLRNQIASAANFALSPEDTPRGFLLEVLAELSRQAGARPIKVYDVVITYSGDDAAVATSLASDLRGLGYTVWIEREESLIGRNILDEAYSSIRAADFLIVLITNNSVRSQWIRDDLTDMRLRELDNLRVVIVPVKCDVDVAIPEMLALKRVVDMSESRERGIEALARAIDVYRSEEAVQSPTPVRGQPQYAALLAWVAHIAEGIHQYGYDAQLGGHKDVIVGAADGEDPQVARHTLRDLLDRTRIRLKGWGGPHFPYSARGAQTRNIPDGFFVADTANWPYSAWNFHYLQFSIDGRFFQRSGLYEDGDLSQDGVVKLRGCLSVAWVLKDVCTALMFARRLLIELPALETLTVRHRLLGMTDRRLVSRRFTQWNIGEQFVAHEETIEESAIIARTTDLASEALRICRAIFWVFNWDDPSDSLLSRDIRSLLNGVFPSAGW
jgi:hypothetical protein